MPTSSRRRFLRHLALTATSAPMLSPFIHTLISDAHAAAARRCFVVFVVGETTPVVQPLGFVPSGIPVGEGKNPMERFGAVDQLIPKLPSMFAPLEPYRAKIALVDGLYNLCGTAGMGALGTQHGTGWGCLTGNPPSGGTNEYGGSPTAISIDQAIARVIGKSTPVPSLQFGFNGKEPADMSANTFATGPGQPIAHIGKPSLLYARLLGNKGSGAAPEDPNRGVLQTRLLDSMREDARRLQMELAGEERARLDQYLSAIAEYDQKQAQLAQVRGSVDCSGVPQGQGMDGTPEQRLEAMFKMASMALKCGLTNVVGVSVGSGFTHGDLALMRGTYGGDNYYAHGVMGQHDGYWVAMNKIYGFFSRLVADTLTALGPQANNTVFMFVPGSGATITGHHAWVRRFPCLVYDGTGTLKTGGRYLRYALNQRSVLDLYTSVAHAAGAPMDSFNSIPLNPSRGPLEALMA